MAKHLVIRWSKDKWGKNERLLWGVEEAITFKVPMEGFRFLTNVHKEELYQLENKRRKFLMDKEKEQHLTSKAIWLEAGDENMKFVNCYANCRKNINFV